MKRHFPKRPAKPILQPEDFERFAATLAECSSALNNWAAYLRTHPDKSQPAFIAAKALVTGHAVAAANALQAWSVGQEA